MSKGLAAKATTKSAGDELCQSLGDCPDCYGEDTSDVCFRCDGSGTICDVCGEAPEACHCPRGAQ